MIRVLALVLSVAAVLVPVAGASTGTGFSFGRIGGNIQPYTVTIASSGDVRVSGSVQVGRTHLTKAQLATLGRVVTTNHFAGIPPVTSCPHTLPDIAATFVRVAGRTVRVHGTCVARYAHVWAALQAAVKVR